MPDCNLLDMADDYRVWDSTEKVEYVSRRSTGDMNDTISGIRRHQVSLKESAASGGAYAAGDVLFYVPRVRVSAALGEPKMGDVLVDDEESRWTVINIDHRKRDRRQAQTYKLLARNLAVVYDLQDVIQIETPVMVLDSTGAEKVTNWEVRCRDLAARVQLVSEAVAEERGIRGFKGTYAVTVDREVSVSEHDRVAWYGTPRDHKRPAFNATGAARVPQKYLHVVGYHAAQSITELPVLDCEAVP